MSTKVEVSNREDGQNATRKGIKWKAIPASDSDLDKLFFFSVNMERMEE